MEKIMFGKATQQEAVCLSLDCVMFLVFEMLYFFVKVKEAQ